MAKPKAVFCGAMLLAVASLPALDVSVDVGDVRTITGDEADAIIASGEDLIKRGGGRFVIDRPLIGYKGSICVEEGYLRAIVPSALGDADVGTVTVSSGATLEFGSDTDELLFGNRLVLVSGRGVNGEGALCHVGQLKDQWRAVFERVTLTGDTRFGGIPYESANGGLVFRRWDIRGSTGKLDMGGHNLEISCGFGLCRTDVLNPGNITVTNIGASATFYLEGSSVNLGGGTENTLTVREGCALSSQRFSPAIAWSVALDGCILREQNPASGGSAETAAARIDGPVRITEKGVRINGGAGRSWSFGGEVDVSGSVMTDSAGTRLHVIQSENDPTGCRMAVVDALFAASNSKGLSILLTPLVGDRDAPAVSGADWDGGWHCLTVDGNGAIALTGNQTDAKYYQCDGYVKIAGADKDHTFSDLLVTGDAVLDLSSAGQVDVGTNRFDVGAVYPAIAKVRIADTLVTTNWPAKKSDKNDGAIRIGPARDATKDYVSVPTWGNSRGILEIGENACVTGLLHVGVVNDPNNVKKTNHGSVIQRGGNLTLFSTAQYAYNFIGHGGSGYMETSDGQLTLLGHFHPGAGKYGRGAWYVKGGIVKAIDVPPIFGQYSRSDTGSKGVFYQTGGRFESQHGIVSGKTLYDSGNAANEDAFTFAGGIAVLDNGIDLAGAPDAKSILNLKSGASLETYWIQLVTNEQQTIVGNGADKAIVGSRAWINLDGGVLKYRHGSKNTRYAAYKAESFFYGDPERLTVTAYAGGAKFDTSGFNVNLDHSIRAPAGRGLASLSLPAGTEWPDGTWVGAPMVEIVGDGSGASAVAEFDSLNCRVTGFTVTSPGCGYTALTARLTRGGYTNEVPLSVTLTDENQASGGLTKIGDGTLVVKAANTYGGTTRVEGGTLQVAHENAIPAGSQIEIAGGEVDFGGFARDFGAVSATSGAIRNASGTMASLVKTGSGAFFLDAPISVTGMIDVRCGTLRLPASRPGFVWGSRVYAAEADMTEYSDGVALTDGGYDLEPSLAYDKCRDGGYFQPRHYVTYSGYVWNNGTSNCTWTFAFAFDDELNLHVDGKRLAKEGSSEWGKLRRASVTLTPGPHRLLIQLYNGAGIGGATRNDVVGIAYDPLGRNSENANDYVPLKDPGDGSLVTVMPYNELNLPTFEALRFASGTRLDLSGASCTLTNELRLTAKVREPVAIDGRLIFGVGSGVTIEDLDGLDRDAGSYVLARATEGFGGIPPALVDGNWRLRRIDDGKTLVLQARRGMVVTIR